MRFLVPAAMTLAALAHAAYSQCAFEAMEADPTTGQLSFQWASQPAAQYDVHYSTVLPSRFQSVGAITPWPYEFVYADHSFTAGGQTRVQLLFFAADFPSVPASHRNLVGYAERIHPDNGTDAIVTGPIQVLLATTTATALTASYSQNIAASDGQVLVLDGMVTNRVTNSDFHLQKFEIDLPFSKPFPYDPAGGKNLLVEFSAPQPWSHTFEIDGWMTGPAATLLGPGGLLRNWGFVVCFTFADYDGTVTKNVPSQGESTTVGPFANPAPDASQLYFAIETE